ncbi:MAG: aspartyl protease family protein [Gemmataceae bacterium]
MGKVVVEVMVENNDDLTLDRYGKLEGGTIRRVTIPDALVDTGATALGLPKRLIDELGLKFVKSRPGMTASGPRELRVYGPTKLTIMDRDCTVDAIELPDGCPVLIGQIPLECLDFVVDPRNQRLIGNPAHGGEQIIEMY